MSNNFVEHLKEVNAWHNMLEHLKSRFNYKQNTSVSIKDALTNLRVATSLLGRTQDFLDQNRIYLSNVKRLQSASHDLTIILDEIGKEFGEENESILESKDRLLIEESLEKIEEGIIYLSGHIVVSIELAVGMSVIPDDLQEFAINIKNKYEEVKAEEHLRFEISDIAEETNRDVELVEAEHEGFSKFHNHITLDTSSNDKDKPKKIISTNIDDI